MANHISANSARQVGTLVATKAVLAQRISQCVFRDEWRYVPSLTWSGISLGCRHDPFSGGCPLAALSSRTSFLANRQYTGARPFPDESQPEPA
jgi:hypothetical protein